MMIVQPLLLRRWWWITIRSDAGDPA